MLRGGLFNLAGRSSWAVEDDERRQAGLAEIERRAQSYGPPPIRWPDPWPTNYLTAMRAATYAFTIGKGRDFTLQAFRNAFQHGRDLSITANVVETGEQAGIHRDRLTTGTREPQIKEALRRATDTAFQLGVYGVPTIAIDDELFWGDDRPEDAAAHLLRTSEPSRNAQDDPISRA